LGRRHSLRRRRITDRRFARCGDGAFSCGHKQRINSGAAAFLALWGQLPRLRLIAGLLSIPPLSWLLERGYRVFLRIRPTRKLADCDVRIK